MSDAFVISIELYEIHKEYISKLVAGNDTIHYGCFMIMLFKSKSERPAIEDMLNEMKERQANE
jgi:hypothetical protein